MVAYEHDSAWIPADASLRRSLSVRGYGLLMSALFRPTTPPSTMRARFERMSARSRERLAREVPGLSFRNQRAGELAIESVCALARPRCTVVHLHGGGYVMGSIASYRRRAVQLSLRFGAEVFLPDYRLAPEHPYPAALEDCLRAVRFVQALRPALPLLLTGDSAGGGLALSVMLGLRDAGGSMPDAAVLISPWVDLTLSGAPVRSPRASLVWPRREHLMACARHYVGSAYPREPGLSPLFGELAGLPELLVVAGEDEVLLDDAQRLVEWTRATDTRVRLVVGAHMQHNWPLALPWLDESQRAWTLITRFVDERLARGPARSSHESEP